MTRVHCWRWDGHPVLKRIRREVSQIFSHFWSNEVQCFGEVREYVFRVVEFAGSCQFHDWGSENGQGDPEVLDHVLAVSWRELRSSGTALQGWFEWEDPFLMWTPFATSFSHQVPVLGFNPRSWWIFHKTFVDGGWIGPSNHMYFYALQLSEFRYTSLSKLDNGVVFNDSHNSGGEICIVKEDEASAFCIAVCDTTNRVTVWSTPGLTFNVEWAETKLVCCYDKVFNCFIHCFRKMLTWAKPCHAGIPLASAVNCCLELFQQRMKRSWAHCKLGCCGLALDQLLSCNSFVGPNNLALQTHDMPCWHRKARPEEWPLLQRWTPFFEQTIIRLTFLDKGSVEKGNF